MTEREAEQRFIYLLEKCSGDRDRLSASERIEILELYLLLSYGDTAQ